MPVTGTCWPGALLQRLSSTLAGTSAVHLSICRQPAGYSTSASSSFASASSTSASASASAFVHPPRGASFTRRARRLGARAEAATSAAEIHACLEEAAGWGHALAASSLLRPVLSALQRLQASGAVRPAEAAGVLAALGTAPGERRGEGVGAALEWLATCGGSGPALENAVAALAQHFAGHASTCAPAELAAVARGLARLPHPLGQQPAALEALEAQLAQRAGELSGGQLVDAAGGLLELGGGAPATLAAVGHAAKAAAAKWAPNLQAPKAAEAVCLATALRQLAQSCDPAHAGAYPEQRSLQLLSFDSVAAHRRRVRGQELLQGALTVAAQGHPLLQLVTLQRARLEGPSRAVALAALARMDWRLHQKIPLPLLALLDDVLKDLRDASASPLQGLTLDPDSLALALHAAVRLPLRPAMQAKATSAMGAALVPRAGELSDTGLGRAAWAAARLRRAPEGLWAALEGRLLELRQEGVAHPHALANLMWAFVAAQRCSPAILDMLTAAAWRMADELSLAEVASVLWALRLLPADMDAGGATAQALGARLLGAVEACLSAEEGVEPADLASTLRSVADLGLDLTQQQVELVVGHAVASLPAVPPAILASVLHSLPPTASQLPRGGRAMTPLFDAAAPHVAATVADFSTGELASIAWAFATLHEVHNAKYPDLMDAIAATISDRCGEAGAVGLREAAKLAWAYAALGHHDSRLMDSLAGAALCTLLHAGPLDLSMLAWAFSTLAAPAPELFAGLRAQLAAQPPGDFDSTTLANILYSFAAVGELTPELAASVQPALSTADSAQPLGEEELGRLFMAHLAIVDAAPADTKRRGLLPPRLLERARAVWNRELAVTAERGREQPKPVLRAVTYALDRMGIAYREWALTADGLLLVPLACAVRAGASVANVAVRVYGPMQRSSTDPPRLLGKVQLQNRLLEARGWRVVGLMQEEWLQLEYLYDQIEYIEAKLLAEPAHPGWPGSSW
eukprot:jgi/Tetstr1/443013/TSEL_031073.t1